MTAKQNAGAYAPDGSLYITLTDGAGTLVTTGAGPTIGTTTITGGTTGRVLYDNAGVIGEYPITGTTNVVLSNSPSLVTPALGVATGTSLAIGGATIGSNALAVTGTALFNNGVNTPVGSAGTNSVQVGAINTGLYSRFSTVLTLASAGAAMLEIGNLGAGTGITIQATEPLSWSSSGISGAPNLFLYKDAANTLAQRNGVNAQRFKAFNTWTDASNGEWFDIDWITNANVATIGTNNNGTGVARNLRVNIGGANKLDYGVTTAATWTLTGTTNVAGVLSTTSTNAVQAGGNSIANTSRASGRGFVVQAPSAGEVDLMAPSDGVATFTDAAGTSFGRLQFGGTTSSFPAIARDGAGTKFVGGDGTSVSWIKVPGVTVANLPAAATAGAGAVSFVTDANTTFVLGLGATVVGGGSGKVPVYSDGSNWIIG